jgi:hypothetical protein
VPPPPLPPSPEPSPPSSVVVTVPPELLHGVASHDSALVVGIIAGAVSAAIFLIGEAIKWMYRRADRAESAQRVYRKYADPIQFTTDGLLWRMKEIFDGSGAGYYLVGREHHAPFEHYKAISTLYRLAALLGWIRALRRELFFLPDRRSKKMRTFEAALSGVGFLLADGGHMEVARVASLVAILHPGFAAPPDKVAEAGTHLDYEIDRKLLTFGAASLRELTERNAREVVSMADQLVSTEFGLPLASQQVLDSEWRKCMDFLAAREAWIYRDWQAAIGDLMLNEAAGGERKYEVMGFLKFEEMLGNGSPEQKKWLNRLNSLFEEFDVKAAPEKDARIDQLKRLYSACGQILIAIHEIDRRHSNVGTDALQAAKAAAGRT